MKSSFLPQITINLLASMMLLTGVWAARAQGLSFKTNQAPIFLGIGAEPSCVIAADVNGDGFVDLVTADNGSNTLTVLTNTGNGRFVLAANITVGNGPYCVVAADFNGDGKLDLACVNEFDGPPGTLTVLTNAGGTRFVQAANIPVGGYPMWVAAADFNGDGKIDLVCANSGDDTLTVLTNTGKASFIASSTNPVGSMPYFVLAADVNNDGFIDLVSANSGDNTVTVLTNNGHGIFVKASTCKVQDSPASIAAANFNFNGNKMPDLIVANWGSDTLTVLTNRGGGNFGTFANLAVGQGPESVAVADVIGDGLPDLISANGYDNSLTVLIYGGLGYFNTHVVPGVGNTPYCVAVTNVTGNGKMDLICANLSDSTVTVLTNSGQVFLGKPAYSAAAGFQATLNGYSGSVYAVETSTDLVHWSPRQYAALTNAALRFTDASSLPSRFYRAVLLTVPVLANPAYSPRGGFQASLLGTAGNTCVIQASTNLLAWTPLLTNVNTNGVWVFTDAATNLARRFYRALSP